MGVILIIAGALILFALLAIYLHKLEPAPRAESEYEMGDRKTRNLMPLIKARFDPRIFIVSENLRKELGVGRHNPNSHYDENLPERWTRMLDMYPGAPQSDAEREVREQQFWERYTNQMWKVNSERRPVLLPKQDIMDVFIRMEKWVFRDYYAATGIVHKTIVEDMARHALKRRQAYALSGGGDEGRRKRERDIETATDAEERFWREALPAHHEKWGEWFYFNILESFKNATESGHDYGPQAAATPAKHPARDDLSYKPNA